MPGVVAVAGSALDGLLEHIEDFAVERWLLWGAPSWFAVPGGDAVPGGALDGLHEHIEDGASVRELMPRSRWRSLDCLLGSAGAR